MVVVVVAFFKDPGPRIDCRTERKRGAPRDSTPAMRYDALRSGGAGGVDPPGRPQGLPSRPFFCRPQDFDLTDHYDVLNQLRGLSSVMVSSAHPRGWSVAWCSQLERWPTLPKDKFPLTCPRKTPPQYRKVTRSPGRLSNALCVYNDIWVVFNALRANTAH